MIEEALDATTISHLQSTGIDAGWRCLEIGPGAGSIMKWMGGIVGASGAVVAVDLKTIHIRHLADTPYRILERDLLDAALDGAFDLAHCRYVLIHNSQSTAMLKKPCSVVSRAATSSSKNRISPRQGY
jgi:hypothetical protein